MRLVLAKYAKCLGLLLMVMVTTACIPACCCAAGCSDCTKCLTLLLMMMMMMTRMMMYLHAGAQLVNGLAAAMPTVLQPLCCVPCAQHSACRHMRDSDTRTHARTHMHIMGVLKLWRALDCPHGGQGGCPRVPVGQGHRESQDSSQHSSCKHSHDAHRHRHTHT
jgi:hypothetical protein